MAIIDEQIPDFLDDAPILSRVDERELLAADALAALAVEPDEATRQAQARVEELRALQQQASQALVGAETAAQTAQAALHDAIGARLKGAPCHDEAEVKAAAVSAELEYRALIEYQSTLGADLKAAEQDLADAVLCHKREAAMGQWNALAAEQRQLCVRLSKSLREVRAWCEKLEAGARTMEGLGAALGQRASWGMARRRILSTHLQAALYGLVEGVDYVSGGKRQIANAKLTDLWPFAQVYKPLDSLTAPAEDGPC